MTNNQLLLDELLRIAERIKPQQAEANKSWFFEHFKAADRTVPSPTTGPASVVDLAVRRIDTGTNVPLDLSKLSRFCIYLMKTVHSLTEPHLYGDEQPNVATPKSNECNLKGSMSAPTLHDDKQALPSSPIDIKEIQRELLRAQKESRAQKSQQNATVGSPAPGTHNCATSTPSKSPFNGNRSMGNWSTPHRSFDGGHKRNRSFQSYNHQQQQQQQTRTPKSGGERGGLSQRGRSSGGAGVPAPCLGDFIVTAPKRNQQQQKKKKQAQQQQQQQQQQQKPQPQKKRVELKTVSGGGAKEAKTATADVAQEANNSVQALFSEAVEADVSFHPADDREALHLELTQLKGDLVDGSHLSLDERAAPVSATPAPIRAALTSAVDTVQAGARTAQNIFKIISFANRRTIERLAQIYSILIDLNLCTNVLSEIGFAVNLLNSVKRRSPDSLKRAIHKLNEKSKNEGDNDDDDDGDEHRLGRKLSKSLPSIFYSTTNSTSQGRAYGALHVLDKFTNSLYFAYHVLRMQAPQLAMLDLKSLGIVLDTVRQFGGDLCDRLVEVYQAKLVLNVDHLMAEEFGVRAFGDVLFQSVSFDEDCDSRRNFSSNAEFAAFKNQRDLFYRALKRWDNNINCDRLFHAEIVPMIKEILGTSDSTINMTHLARLFVAQLLLTASSRAAVVEDIGVNIEAPKLSRLMQRLVQTGTFNQEDNFPGKQEFFVLFIRSAESEKFRCQLKLALFAELLSLQDNEQYAALRSAGSPRSSEQHLVQWSVMANMMVLAKFLGYVTSLPYTDARQPKLSGELEQQQLILRNLFQNDFDVYQLLADAMRTDRLIVTLPWVIQYMVMLDMLSMKLDSYKRVMELICAIYLETTSPHSSSAKDKQPAVNFILRTCIGWLFEEKPYLLEHYYSYLLGQNAIIRIADDYKSFQLCTPSKCNANSECLVTVSCPFLSRFRTTLQSEHKKGQFRQVTTQLLVDGELQSLPHCPADETTAEGREKAEQNRLIEAFLHSLNSPKRKLVEFLVDRIYKGAIKDARLKLLVPAKARADADVNDISDKNFTKVYDKVEAIYKSAMNLCLQKWPIVIADALEERTPKALDALLPSDTHPNVKLTYALVIRSYAEAKIEEWRRVCLIKSNFFCESLADMALKIYEVNKGYRRTRRVPKQNTVVSINAVQPHMSEYMHELHRWLHMTSLRIDQVHSIDGIVECLLKIPQAFVHKFPTLLYYLLSNSLIQLTHNLVAHKPELIDGRYIAALCALWKDIEEADIVIGSNKLKSNREECDMPGIYETLVTPLVISAFDNRRECFAKFQEVLMAMLREKLITLEFLNVNFVAVLKTDWHSDVLHYISTVMRNLSGVSWHVSGYEQANTDDEKSKLFMEMLADFASEDGEL